MITEVPHAYQLLSKLPSCQPSQFISHWLNLSGCQTKNVYLNVTNLRQKLKLKNHLTGHVLFKIWSCAWCGPQNFMSHGLHGSHGLLVWAMGCTPLGNDNLKESGL